MHQFRYWKQGGLRHLSISRQGYPTLVKRQELARDFLDAVEY